MIQLRAVHPAAAFIASVIAWYSIAVSSTLAATFHFVGGINDNFAPPTSPANPSPGLLAFLVTNNPNPYDATTLDRWFAETFRNCPMCITGAEMEIMLKPLGGGSNNDSIRFGFTDGFGNVIGPYWGKNIGLPAGNQSVLNTNWTTANFPNGWLFNFDLAALPLGNSNANGSTPNLIPALRQHKFLDIMIQDDTSVDYIDLEITTGLAGDMDGDGCVDQQDFQLVTLYFGQAPPLGVGDPDGNGLIDILDLGLVQADFGKCCPEPTSAGLALLAATLWGGFVVRRRCGANSASTAIAVVLLAAAIQATPCSAGTVTGLTVSNISSPTQFLDDLVTGIKRETQSSAALVSSNLSAPMPTFSARLAGMAAADTELPAVSQVAQIHLAMNISFNIVAPPTEPWCIFVDQTRNLALTMFDDPPPVHFQSQARVDLHTATYSLSPGGSGNLQFPTTGVEDTVTVSGFGNVDIPINQSVSDTLTGTGPTTVQLVFLQRVSAYSYANDNPNATVLAPGQEGAVRFGMVGTLTNVSADDYPGFGLRNPALDGHFVNVKVKFVPEPGTCTLATFGLGSLALCGFRRRSARRRHLAGVRS